MTTNGHPKWSFKEFSTFLLIYAASADHIVAPEEEAMMKERIDEQIYNKILEEHDQLNDYQKAQVILEYKGLYFPTTDRKQELIDLMKKQFLSDGVFSQLEKNLMLVLERLM